tara:strand:- start:114 stop:260 length:147 start_codon:yes stop_codon:yes gene_type:complete
MIHRKLVGGFYHHTTKLSCLLFLVMLNSCAKYEPNPYTTIVRFLIDAQ